jgi:glycerol-3-phosphate dehydrogenase subunit B
MDSRWHLREPALGLPVGAAPEGERFRPGYFDEQPTARAGVVVDRELRPLDAAGDPVLANVRVTGATLAGAEPWREKSGEGLSLATGYRAAELVREAAGHPKASVGG